MGNVLRSVHRCVVSHKFYDGLPAASDCAQSIEMYCHTWKYLRGEYFWSGSGLYLHASPGKEYTDSLSFVSFICECSYDLDRVENPNTQRISKGICGIICQCISARGSIYMAAAVCACGKSFFGAAVGSYYLVIGIWKFLLYLQRMNKYQYTVTVYASGESCTIHALLDTGNSLCDPVTGKPVCILGKRQAGEILKEKELQTLRYIPYCSVGTEKGVLPVIRAEKMCIHTGQECWVEKPLIGICEEDSFTNGEYQMILNPAILGGV